MTTGKSSTRRLGAAQLDRLIEEAIVDCYDEYEQAAGFLATLEDKVPLPFATCIFGVDVQVVAFECDDGLTIDAVCEKDGERQTIGLSDLPLPDPPPPGAAWIAAYRRSARFAAPDGEEDE